MFCIYKSNLKYYLAILRLMCVNAILSFRAPSKNTMALTHFETNSGLQDRDVAEVSRPRRANVTRVSSSDY